MPLAAPHLILSTFKCFCNFYFQWKVKCGFFYRNWRCNTCFIMFGCGDNNATKIKSMPTHVTIKHCNVFIPLMKLYNEYEETIEIVWYGIADDRWMVPNIYVETYPWSVNGIFIKDFFKISYLWSKKVELGDCLWHWQSDIVQAFLRNVHSHQLGFTQVKWCKLFFINWSRNQMYCVREIFRTNFLEVVPSLRYSFL